jgi:DNA-binding MarR family transcriptional regulator
MNSAGAPVTERCPGPYDTCYDGDVLLDGDFMTQSRRRSPAQDSDIPSDLPIDMHGVEDQIGFVLRLAQLAVFKDIIETLGPFGLRPSDFSALRVIAANPGLKQQDIGRELGIKRPNLVGLVEELRKKKLIERRVVPGDRRSYALTLTKVGETLLETAEEAHRGHQLRIREALGDNDPLQFLAGLRSLARLGAGESVE